MIFPAVTPCRVFLSLAVALLALVAVFCPAIGLPQTLVILWQHTVTMKTFTSVCWQCVKLFVLSFDSKVWYSGLLRHGEVLQESETPPSPNLQHVFLWRRKCRKMLICCKKITPCTLSIMCHDLHIPLWNHNWPPLQCTECTEIQEVLVNIMSGVFPRIIFFQYKLMWF